MGTRMLKLIVMVCGMVFLAGCTSQQLMRRVQTDLSCPKDQIEIEDLDDGSVEVRGCGRTALYKEVCKPCSSGKISCDCQWHLTDAGVRKMGRWD